MANSPKRRVPKRVEVCCLGICLSALLPALVRIGVDLCKRDAEAVATLWTFINAHVASIWAILLPPAIVVGIGLGRIAWRAIQSWRYGVVSGAFFWSFVITAWLFRSDESASPGRTVAALLLIAVILVLSVAFRLWASVHRERTIRPTVVKPSQKNAGQPMRDPESPIECWNEDRLGRAAVVEILARKILDARTPVIALRGAFGDGKSSVLNLLRLHLAESAVVVSFSSWLPNSELTLANDLFADIAAECNRHLLVPALRKHLRKFASLLAGSVSYLKPLPDILPPYTQRQEIRDLGEALSRVPKRVVVLLDEIDRMQKPELLTLLKIIRGAASLPNLTFVCALNQGHVEKVAFDEPGGDAHEFFEKFFPTVIDLPKPSPDVLQQMLTDQLSITFERCWFKNETERNEFAAALKDLWKNALIHVCGNIRKTSLLLNDIVASAQLTEGEVNPLDLSSLAAVKRFFPGVYEVIWTNGAFFSNSYGWWKSLSSSRSEQEVAAEVERIGSAIKGILEKTKDGEVAKTLLRAMFPVRTRELFGERRGFGVPDEGLDKAEAGKRIAHPDFFPIYFQCDVPATLFSAREMDVFLDSVQAATSDVGRRTALDAKFASLDDGSVRRYDFIHKLCLRIPDLPIEVGRSLALAISANTAGLGDDFLVSERRRALGGVFAVAQRLSDSDAVNGFLAQCVEVASSDLFAVRVLKFSTTERSKNQVLQNFQFVREDCIRAAFTERMASQYCGSAPSTPTRSDIYAFSVWAEINDSERKKEISFWERFIGQSRARLAEAFDLMAPAGVIWTKDSTAFIDRMLPIDTLRRMYSAIPEIDALNPEQQKALNRLKRFLDGHLRDGEVLDERPLMDQIE